MSSKHVDRAITAVIFVVFLGLLLATTSDLGYARDEGFYFQAARSYQGWFETLLSSPSLALRPRVVDAAWSQNHEHPSLMKALFALSHLVLGRRHLFSLEGTTFRFPAMVFSAGIVAFVYRVGARRFGRLGGAFAAIALGMSPCFFYHAHLACFDAPIVAMYAFTLFAYAKSLRTTGARWPLVTGLVFGLTLETKHNAWFLPIVCLAHAAICAALAWLSKQSVIGVLKRPLASLSSMAVIGPVVLYALWPWIWHDTIHRLTEYVQFHLNHEYYNMEFLGENYFEPPMPRGYAWLMTAATVPTVTLVLFVVGLSVRARVGYSAFRSNDAEGRLDAREDLLFVLGLVFSYAAWLSTGTPIFGGTKHWMTAYPFMALFAAAGVSRSIAALSSLLRERVKVPPIAVGLAALLAFSMAPITETLHAHPFGLTGYVPLVGGAPGAATLGLNRSFWGYTTESVAPFMNETAPRRARVYFHDTAWQSWEMLVEEGRVRRDLVAVPAVSDADLGIYHQELHMQGQEYQAWLALGTLAPVEIAGLDGVPIVWIYRRAPTAAPSR